MNSQEREKWKYWLDTIETEASDKLTQWESNFIASITIWLTHSNLTAKQSDTLERIYVKYTK
jgi:hypothetical protein